MINKFTTSVGEHIIVRGEEFIVQKTEKLGEDNSFKITAMGVSELTRGIPLFFARIWNLLMKSRSWSPKTQYSWKIILPMPERPSFFWKMPSEAAMAILTTMILKILLKIPPKLIPAAMPRSLWQTAAPPIVFPISMNPSTRS